MTKYFWTGTDGDWSDGANWSGGSPPPADGAAVFLGGSEQTLYGYASFEDMDVKASDLTLAGDFEGYDASSSITDAGTAPSDQQTLAISSWGYVTATAIDLTNTTLSVQGALLVDHGSLGAVSVSGAEGFLGVNSGLGLTSLSVSQGAVVQGNLSLAADALVTVDDISSLGTGVITTSGDATLVVNSTVSTPETVSVGNTLAAEAGQTLTVSTGTGVVLALAGAVTGTGTVAFTGQSVQLEAGASVQGTLLLASSTLDFAAGATAVSGVIILDNSQLSVDGTPVAVDPIETISCTGTADQVQAGTSNLFLAIASGSQLRLTGSGNSTVSGGDGSILNLRGSESVTLRTAANNSDLVFLGQDSTGVASSQITLVGMGNTEVVNTAADSILDGRESSGSDTFYGGTGGGVTTVFGGSGDTLVTSGSEALDVVGGSGNLVAFAGTSGRDHLFGGTGNNTLVGGTGTTLIGTGAGFNLLVGSGGGCLLDLAASSGNGVVFLHGDADAASLVGGAGADEFVVQQGNALITTGTGQETIWASSGANETVTGAPDQLTIVTNGGGSSLNLSEFGGVSTVFADGSGTNSVIGGNGPLTLVAGAGPLYALGGSGYNAIWGGSSGHDTIIGGVGANALFGQDGAFLQVRNSQADYLSASGANVTLNGAGSNGWVTYDCNGNATGTAIYTGSGTSMVDAGGTSDELHVVGGNVILNCGTGSSSVFLDETSVIGTLNVYGFNPNLDHISVSGGAERSEVASFGLDTALPVAGALYMYGNETVIFHAPGQTGG